MLTTRDRLVQVINKDNYVANSLCGAYVEAEAVNFFMYIYKKNLEENHGMDLVTRPIY